jgi:hypothetical protein
MSVEFNKFFFAIDKLDQEGFSDENLAIKVGEIPCLREQVIAVSRLGYRYAGDTRSNSKANTEPVSKKIFIGKNKPIEEAILSLAYELTNAKNGKKLAKILDNSTHDLHPNQHKAECFAMSILKVEAEAVYIRSSTAINLGKESTIKNPKYTEIVKKYGGNREEAILEIYHEMLKNGMVHEGRKKAFDHYVDCYWENYLD